MNEKQKTIKEEVSLNGYGLHTGNKSNVRLKPAPEGNGIRFIRVDLPGTPALQVGIENIVPEAKVPRCTSLGKGDLVVHTVEHLMSVLAGLGIDNLNIEIDNTELPGLDGSGLEYLTAIKKAGLLEQSAERQYIDIKEPIGINRNGAAILIVPDDAFRVSYTLDYPHPFLSSQFFNALVTPQVFETEIAPCRTFCLETEEKELRSQGLGKGANYHNTIVIGDKGVLDNTLRFPNECARHKVLDLVGDLYLLGRPIRGQVFAIKSGHTLNTELLRRVHKQQKHYESKGFAPVGILGDQTELNVQQIMQILPHRYPFLLIDRILKMEGGQKIVAIKNLTINDNFFAGHFPTRPIMPGVLMVEAMAQAGGVLMLTTEAHRGKLALFAATDNVKFRKSVVPGDQLVMEVEVVRDRSKVAFLRGIGKVGDDVVVEADLTFSFMDASFLD